MNSLQRTRAHYEGLALEALFTRRDPGMRTDPIRAELRRAGILDENNQPIVEIDDAAV